MGQDKTDWRKILKIVLLVFGVIVLGLVVVFIVFIVCFVVAISSATKIDTSVVREKFEDSGLTSLSYFKITEDKTKAKKGKIFLNIEGVDADAFYMCDSAGFAKVCHIEVSDLTSGMGYIGLSEYFWNLHQSEIEDMLAKYPNLRLSQDEEIEIDVLNNDRAAARNFLQELFQISDMYSLYQAFKATDNYGNFGDFWMEIYDESGRRLRGGLLLFSWARENGF